MLTVHNFTFGLLTPALAYLMSCLGAFLGLRCTTRSRASSGASRARWLVVAGVSIGVLGCLYPAWRVTRMAPLKGLSRAA